MSNFKLKSNKIMLFTNQKKKSFKSPNFYGKVAVEGLELSISAWLKGDKIDGKISTLVNKSFKVVGKIELSKNTNKVDEQPDYKGILNYNSVDYKTDLWIKQGQKGKYLSGNIVTPASENNKGLSPLPTKVSDDIF